ncbi:interleukin-1 receptor-associated kinase 1 isoform X2 [Syngnathus typhle]|uniref:interleukin-1 receptor-associated kinase 1 isoform X2 n=1 Tax=Syngnathus typhle TaxID=161592 RepID=UPI002A6A66EB|nr:interleukin-1 receptor-associated kinase 1 isoform X2 [Syngnathus typhle]
MSQRDVRSYFLHSLPATVHWEFCCIMDGLSELDWTRFASEVLGDQVSVRLAQKKEMRTAYVMNQWGNRNGRVGELLDLLEHHQLFHPRDVILLWALSLKESSHALPVSLSNFDPPAKSVVAPLPMATNVVSTTGGEGALPRPAPPPSSLHSCQPRTLQGPPLVASSDASYGVMCWSYEEVHAGTEGFSPALQIGEGGFGVVYRASLRNTDCAVKRLKQDCVHDFNMLKESFNTEVEKLSKFRHPNIVDLLGFCQGPSVCLIYTYMEKRSLEDQLHSVSSALTWDLRVRIVHEASAALQYLHFPPEEHTPVIHGDVKSSNILLDRHLVAKLADFGLARFVSPNSSNRLVSKTTTLGQKSKVRGTLAYLPEEYMRDGQPGTPVDVYSFGVVLLEVLTGRRALEENKKLGDIYLKDVIQEVWEDPADSYTAAWSKQLDRRLITGDPTELAGSMDMVELACRCLERKWKKRPAMTEVFNNLQDISNLVRKHDRPSPHCVSHGYPHSSDSSVEVVTQQLSNLGPLENTYHPPIGSLPTLPPPPPFSKNSFHSSIATSPLPVHYSSLPPYPPSLQPHASFFSLPPLTSSLHASSSFEGPCETDESRGFSQYDLSAGSQFNSELLSLCPPTGDQNQNRAGPTTSLFRETSEDEYRMGPHLSHMPPSGPHFGAGPGAGLPEISSPPGLLQSISPHTLDGVQPCEEFRGPEESDELEYLAATHT